MCVNQGFGTNHIENALEKAIQVLNKKTSGSSIGYKKWRSKPMANTTRNGNNHRNDSKMCKTKPVLNEAWAELRGVGFNLDEAKIRAKGKVQTRQKQNRQYNYEQATSRRHASRPADFSSNKSIQKAVPHFLSYTSLLAQLAFIPFPLASSLLQWDVGWVEVTGLRSTRNVELDIVRLVSVVGTCGLLEHVVIFFYDFHVSLGIAVLFVPTVASLVVGLVQHLGTWWWLRLQTAWNTWKEQVIARKHQNCVGIICSCCQTISQVEWKHLQMTTRLWMAEWRGLINSSQTTKMCWTMNRRLYHTPRRWESAGNKRRQKSRHIEYCRVISSHMTMW